MATAVSAWFGEASERILRHVWRQLAESGVDESLHVGPYRPHLTLGVWEALPPGEAAGVAQAIAATVPQQPITFPVLGAFVDPEPTVFLAPLSRSGYAPSTSASTN